MKVDFDPFKMTSSFAKTMYLSIMVNVKEGLDLSMPLEMVEVDPKPILIPIPTKNKSK